MQATATKAEVEVMAAAARDARGLAIDAISAAKSGHMGLPLGCAEIGANLWGENLQYYPKDPQWLNRDRFILSAGHGSMFIYSWLHMSGYDLPMDEIKNFRQHHSMTPGHPEFPSSEHNTPGIEATTGPLGAGIGNAVGMAAAAKRAADTQSIREKEGAKADLEADLEKTKTEKKETVAAAMDKAEQLRDLHLECDWLLANFDARKEARAGEVEALNNAKAVLSGADYSLVQTRNLRIRRSA